MRLREDEGAGWWEVSGMNILPSLLNREAQIDAYSGSMHPLL